MSQLKRLVSEIHRRSLWQVLGVYALASSVICQVVLALYGGIGLPSASPADAGMQEAAGESAPPSNSTSTPNSLLTWPHAITGGVLAFAALGLATTGFRGMRALGIGPAATLMSRGVLDGRDPILLADFANATPDSTLGELITKAWPAGRCNG